MKIPRRQFGETNPFLLTDPALAAVDLSEYFRKNPFSLTGVRAGSAKAF
jgi:hypothetical protein